MKFITIRVTEHDTDAGTSKTIIEQTQPENLLVAVSKGELNKYGTYDAYTIVGGDYNVLVRLLNTLAARTHNTFITKVEEQKENEIEVTE